MLFDDSLLYIIQQNLCNITKFLDVLEKKN